MLEVTDNKQISRIEIVHACFHSQLSYGTLFYGTRFISNKATFYCVEDIFYYKGRNISHFPFKQKLQTLKCVFDSDIKRVFYNDNMILFGMPIIKSNVTEIVEAIDALPYKIDKLHFKDFEKRNYTQSMKYVRDTVNMKENTQPQTYNNTNNRNNSQYNNNNRNNTNSYIPNQSRNDFTREKVFKVKADLQTDIYKLFVVGSNDITGNGNCEIAYIPTYETSVMMNKLFRNIKENDNLDALEESDDEDEFENDDIGKYVHLDREFNMACVYNQKYRKWVPLRVV